MAEPGGVSKRSSKVNPCLGGPLSLKKVEATPAQKKLLDLIATEGVHRLCFKRERPTGVTLTWCWVGARSYTPVKDSTINACIKRGWVTLTKGSLKPETPPGASGLYIAMNNLREPDTLSLT